MATNSRATDKNPDNPETPVITLLRKASCKSLEGRDTLCRHLPQFRQLPAFEFS